MVDLQRFCGGGGTLYPTRLAGRIYAADGMIGVSVPDDGRELPTSTGKNMRENDEARARALETMFAFDAAALRPFALWPERVECEQCDGRGGEADREKCSTCCGSGRCVCTYCDAEHECGQCDGLGYIEISDPQTCRFCGGSGRTPKDQPILHAKWIHGYLLALLADCEDLRGEPHEHWIRGTFAGDGRFLVCEYRDCGEDRT